MEVVTHKNWKFDYTNGKFIYKINPDTITDSYFKKSDDIPDPKYANFRKAALIHKLVRSNIQKKIHSNVSFVDLYKEAESSLKKFIKPTDIGGFAFPLGISVNEIIAHDTAMLGDDRVLQKNDIVKIDLGVHINGCIIDSAFTSIVDGDDLTNTYYEPLLQATADATYTGICMSGPDVELYELSTAINEVIESYELEDGTAVNAVFGLGGHNVLPYKVHGGKLILSVPHESQKGTRMEEGEIYAIETFATTGYGRFTQLDIGQCNHFMLNEHCHLKQKKLEKNPIYMWAKDTNKGLPFTQTWVKDVEKAQKNLRSGVTDQIIIPFPPLTDKLGSRSSQFEHTINIRDSGVEIFSLGPDY